MYDFTFETRLAELSTLLATATDIGISLDEVVAHLSSVRSQGTQGT